MQNEDKINEEVEKTLNALDEQEYLDGNPYLFTRLQAEIESPKLEARGFLFGKVLRPAILLIIVIFNILTGVYLIDSANQTSTSVEQQYFSKISSEYSLSHSYYSGINQTTGN